MKDCIEYKIEKRFRCDEGIKTKFVVMRYYVLWGWDDLKTFDTYEEAEQFIYELLTKTD